MNNYYECSSRGDTRFSALYARVKSKGNNTIEHIYQTEIKGYNSIKEGKGKKGKLFSWEIQQQKYIELWRIYLEENPDLRKVLVNAIASGHVLHDMFAKGNAMNQATVLTNLVKVG